MDRATVEARLAELRKQFEQVQANGNALLGAIQDCEFWLKQIDTQDGGGHSASPPAGSQ